MIGRAVSHYLIQGKPGSLGWEVQQDWPAAHYHLAKLYQSQGQGARARNVLTAFLQTWKEADPEVPLLLTARKLQAELDRR